MEEEIVISWTQIAAWLSAIVLIGGAGAYVYKWLNAAYKPLKAFKDRIANLEKRADAVEKQLKEMEQVNSAQLAQRIQERNTMIKEIHKDIVDLKDELRDSKQERNLMLHSLLAIGNQIVSKDSADRITEANNNIINHLIDND